MQNDQTYSKGAGKPSQRSQSSSALPLEPLCQYCRQIPFTPAAREKAEEGLRVTEKVNRWSLGHGARVQFRPCPFCKIVTRAYDSLYQTDTAGTAKMLMLQEDVEITWHYNNGPGGRNAFAIDAGALQNWICQVETKPSSAADAHYIYLKHAINPVFDVNRLLKWISVCTTSHKESCYVPPLEFSKTFPGLPVLRLIDVANECLVELRTVPQYVALSYVWGEVPSVRLSTVNRPQLLRRGGIKAAWSALPRTIKDAIELVRKLGARYLWVDAICLVQNEPKDLSLGVNVMDQIYERSWLTIIAASGHNANAGLPGVQEGSRPKVNTSSRILEGLYLGVYVPLDRLLKCSVHSTRAWT
ncbi:heterokaryon incompatibility protein [Colletotrichum truncatum]|uniref:Heterokaryon incompatibility protein n=1 Tax=Colletotrichum truncatum TaxID=5467 RepID=A0ACC3YH47_COLTU